MNPIDISPEKGSSSSPSLQALTELALEGSEEAFESLHRRLYQGIQRYFIKRGHASEAELLCQEVWIDVWTALEERRYQPHRRALDAFSFGVARTVLRNHRRQRFRSSHKLSFLDGKKLEDFVDSREEQSTTESDLGSLEDLRWCLKTALDEAERDLLKRLLYEEVSERTLAQESGTPRSTVNDRKTKSFRKLRNCLKGKKTNDRFSATKSTDPGKNR